MARCLYLLFIFSFICLRIVGQNIDTLKRDFSLQSNRLPYTIFNIGDPKDIKTKIPILLFLHGAGERGNDNKQQLTVGLPVLMKTIIETKNFPCVIIVPQCPVDQKWVNTDWKKLSHQMEIEMTWPLKTTIQLLDSIIKLDSLIDKNRIYLTGISMGGFGTWELLQRFPKKFAAAIPICGGGDTTLASSLNDIPIWAFHGKNDKLVKVSRTTEMVAAINKRQKSAKCTILKNEGHLCWNTAYKNLKAINWLFSQKSNAK